MTLDVASPLAILAPALLSEAIFGYPARLFRLVRHPVVWMGWLIGTCDQCMNRPTAAPGLRRALGIVALALVTTTAASAGWLITQAANLAGPDVGSILLALVASSLLAQRSLHAHVAAVAAKLEQEGLTGGRQAIAHIVGRDPLSLDSAGIARAAIESLAENLSDAVVAPALWLVIGGLPAMLAYKAINTADSMIGHRTTRHAAFGWAAARSDDLVNLPAARLTAVLLVIAAPLAGASLTNALRTAAVDARKHRSPNAGWPEAAMAGALNIALAGPRIYAGLTVDDPWLGTGTPNATAKDIRRALRVYRWSCALLLAAAIAPWLAAIKT